GVSVAGGTAGMVLGLLAKRNENEAFRACPDPEMSCFSYLSANGSIRSSYREAFAANVAYGLAAAAALAAGVLWLTGPGDAETRRVSVAPSVTPSQPGIVVVGRF